MAVLMRKPYTIFKDGGSDTHIALIFSGSFKCIGIEVGHILESVSNNIAVAVIKCAGRVAEVEGRLGIVVSTAEMEHYLRAVLLT